VESFTGSEDENQMSEDDVVKVLTKELLRLPKEFWGFAGIVVIWLTIGFSIYCGIPKVVNAVPRGGKLQLGLQGYDLTVQGGSTEVTPTGDSKRFEFWTPSSQTRFLFCDGELNSSSCSDKCKKKMEKNDDLEDQWECSVEDGVAVLEDKCSECSAVEHKQTGEEESPSVAGFERKLWVQYHCRGGLLNGLRRFEVKGRGLSGQSKSG
jgi:hypothetical protein